MLIHWRNINIPSLISGHFRLSHTCSTWSSCWCWTLRWSVLGNRVTTALTVQASCILSSPPPPLKHLRSSLLHFTECRCTALPEHWYPVRTLLYHKEMYTVLSWMIWYGTTPSLQRYISTSGAIIRVMNTSPQLLAMTTPSEVLHMSNTTQKPSKDCKLTEPYREHLPLTDSDRLPVVDQEY